MTVADLAVSLLLLWQTPRPLLCLEKWYSARAQWRDGAWYALLPDGTALPWDDGRAKTIEQKLAAPDLEDSFSMPYRKGPIRKVQAPEEDPGRIRVDALFAATYGKSEREVASHLVPIDFLGQRLRVHARARAAFERVAARLAHRPTLLPYLERAGGTFVWRPIAGTDRPSAHSYGVSIDINVTRSAYWRWDHPPHWRNQIPRAIVDAFEAEGFIWGGRWYHYDTMHFEYRPELTDPACQRSDR